MGYHRSRRGGAFGSVMAGAAAAIGARIGAGIAKKRVSRNAVVKAHNKSVAARNASVAAVNSRKRQRTEGAKRKTIYDKNQYRQLSTYNAQRGVKLTQFQKMSNLVKASISYSKYIYRSYGYDNAGGASDTGGRLNPCGLEKPGASTLIYYPVYVYNLTAQPQAVKGTLRNPVMGFRLFSDTASVGNVQWYGSVQSLNNAGANLGASYFQPYVTPGNTATGAGQIFPKCILDYVNIKYTLRGPRARPTKFVVEVIQPYKWFGSMPDGQSYNAGDQGVWQEEANRLTANLCQNVPAGHKKPWRVLYSRVYDIQPTSSSEIDVGGHDVHQKYFWRCNRLLKYDSEFGLSDKPDPDSDYSNLNIGTQEYGRTVDTIPEEGAAIYLMIKAYCPTASGGFDAYVHPSFDLSIEKKVTSLNPMTALV